MTAPPPLPLPNMAPRQTCGMAVASLVCGILGFFTLGLTGIPAVILGFLGLSKIKQSKGALGGQGMAIAGLITGGLTLVILGLGILASLLIPTLFSAKAKAQQAMCKSNMQALGSALHVFELDYGAFPSDVTAAQDARFAKLTGAACLKQLEVAGIVKDLNVLLVADSPQGQWLYFPNPDAGEPSSPLLISPPIHNQITIIRMDSSVVLKPASERDAVLRSSKTAPVSIPSTPRKR